MRYGCLLDAPRKGSERYVHWNAWLSIQNVGCRDTRMSAAGLHVDMQGVVDREEWTSGATSVAESIFFLHPHTGPGAVEADHYGTEEHRTDTFKARP